MVDLVLSGGEIVAISEEDYLWAKQITWWAWRDRPHKPAVAISRERRNGREFRLRLLREIAVRMRPEISYRAPRMRVTPKNGDWFDARRENIQIKFRPIPKGRPVKDLQPRGSAYYPIKSKRKVNGGRSNPNASRLWRPRAP